MLSVSVGFPNVVKGNNYFSLLQWDRRSLLLDIVGTVYHLVIYMQFNKIHRVFYDWLLFITYVSSTYFGPHRSIIRNVLWKLYVQIWYVVIRVLLDTSRRYEVLLDSNSKINCTFYRILLNSRSTVSIRLNVTYYATKYPLYIRNIQDV